MFSHALNRLLGRFLKPYWLPLLIVVALQFIATLASLELPTLNADIIDKGVVTGDIDYIWRTGGVMLLVSLFQVVCSLIAVFFGSRLAMGMGRNLRAALFHRVVAFSQLSAASTPSS